MKKVRYGWTKFLVETTGKRSYDVGHFQWYVPLATSTLMTLDEKPETFFELCLGSILAAYNYFSEV